MSVTKQDCIFDPLSKLSDNFDVQELVQLVRDQRKVIQSQAEEIVQLKQQVRDLKDEIDRLRKTPKRPKFKPGGMEPRDRSTTK